MRIRIFPSEDVLLTISTLCDKYGARLEIGGDTRCDGQDNSYDFMGENNDKQEWVTAYIICPTDSVFSAIKYDFKQLNIN